MKIEELNQTILANKEKLKRQQFFLSHLIPKYYQRMIEQGKFDDPRLCTPAFALQPLRKPISLQVYCEADAYINPFYKEIP